MYLAVGCYPLLIQKILRLTDEGLRSFICGLITKNINMETEELNKVSREAAIRVFPYTDEGSLEDDIDNAKRNIYQHGFIEGHTVANKISSNPVLAEVKIGIIKKFVYRLQDEKSLTKTFEIGEIDIPTIEYRKEYKDSWCDRRICEGFWGDEQKVKSMVEMLNANFNFS